MQTQAQLFLTGGTRIVRIFELKSSVKRIVWWYFSWPAHLVRSRQPWPDELSLTALAVGSALWLDHSTSWIYRVFSKHVMGMDVHLDGVCVWSSSVSFWGVSRLSFHYHQTITQAFPRSWHVSVVQDWYDSSMKHMEILLSLISLYKALGVQGH